MPQHPVAAGKSSLDFVDQGIAFFHITAKRGGVYLDLACGAGRYSLALAKHLKDGSVIHAFDLWEEGIATLKEAAGDLDSATIKPEVVDVTGSLPLEDGVVDTCFIATVMHDLPVAKREHVVREIRRVLAPHGALVLIEFKKIDHGPGPRKEHRIGEDDADALVLPQGFEKVASVSLGEFTYLVKYART